MEFAGLPIYSLLLVSSLAAAVPALAAGNETDRLSLLAFKAGLSDPDGILSSWNDTVGLCQWRGIICGTGEGREGRVEVLVLSGFDLAGTISPALSNLTFLRLLHIHSTNLRGRIPPELFLLPRLEEIHLGVNYLSGEIPAGVSNATSLRFLSLTTNRLTGEIPAPLPALRTLNLGHNSLSGALPPSLFNLSSLEFIYLSDNHLTGTLPPTMFNTLTNVKELLLSFNSFSGRLPVSLSNATMLSDIELYWNRFDGTIPDLGRLHSLWWVELSHNLLEARDDDEWGFIASLSKCTSLELLNLGHNNLSGLLPSSIADLPPRINVLNVDSNQFTGTIPLDIGSLINLTQLSLCNNMLVGEIPLSIGNLRRLNVLALSGNWLRGEIPPTIGNLTELNILNLRGNELHGSIPSNLGRCGRLQRLDLSENRLTGPIPAEVMMLGSLSTKLDLSHNLLSGSLPPQISELRNLGRMDLSRNRLSGDIPGSIGYCQSLEFLYMFDNLFEGNVPETLSNLKGLLVLDLSYNNFSRGIPASLQGLHSLRHLDLSFNNLEGEVPTDGVFANASALLITGNRYLCGGSKNLRLPACFVPTSKNKKPELHAIAVGFIVSCTCLGICILVRIGWMILHERRELKKKPSFQSPTEDPFLKISYSELLKATDGFSSSNLIGIGSFSSVYKGVLELNQVTIAIKVLDLKQRGASATFEAECEALKHVRHRNLMKIITICSSTDFQRNDFKALVMKYMVNGSLERWLHGDASQQGSEAKVLTLNQRLNVAVDVASALSYLHEYGHTPIIHRDLKPSNVLLDEDMCAHISDFGLAKFRSEVATELKESTTSACIKGTIGYLAPEYGMGAQASCQGDVYSYGILLLELFTGKRPTDSMFTDDICLRSYVEMSIAQGKYIAVADPSLFSSDEERNRQSALVISVLRIGLACSREDSRERMNIVNAIAEFRSLV